GMRGPGIVCHGTGGYAEYRDQQEVTNVHATSVAALPASCAKPGRHQRKAPGQPGALASGPVSVARAPRPGRARRACGTAATACGATPCTRTVSTGTHVASTRAAAHSGIDAGSIHASCAR